MKQNYSVNLSLSEELLRKLLYVCAHEKRTPNNQFLFMLRNNIAYYEKTKGRIPDAALKEIDISAYLPPEEH